MLSFWPLPKIVNSKYCINKINSQTLRGFRNSSNTSYETEFWDEKKNINEFINKLKDKLKLKTSEDWNSLTYKQIKSNGGSKLLQKYSIYEIKSMGCPNENICFRPLNKPSGFWNDENNISNFLNELKVKLNLKTKEDWNKITSNTIKSLGGSMLLKKYSIYELKCKGYPEGKDYFTSPPKPSGYWKNENNIKEFLNTIKEKLNLKTQEDWNLLTNKKIEFFGGSGLLQQGYSLLELKCLGYPEGKLYFHSLGNKKQEYWKKKSNIIQFLNKIKENYNLYSSEDWNRLTKEQVILLGGIGLLNKYSLNDLKIMAFSDGKSFFETFPTSSRYWNKKENVESFLNELKDKFQLNTLEDWNSLTWKQIHENGGKLLNKKYSLYELKSIGYPEGKSYFNKQKPVITPSNYWNNKENVLLFLQNLKEKFNLNSPMDWNLLTWNQIKSLPGGSRLLQKYSLLELKLMGNPEGKSIFTYSDKNLEFWNSKENVIQFLNELKETLNLNTENDWNLITNKDIKAFGGSKLIQKYSVSELKSIGFPNGNFMDQKQPVNKPNGYWNNMNNVKFFLEELKEKLNLKTFDDWNLLTQKQITSNGGKALLNNYSLFDLKSIGYPEGKSKFKPAKKSPGYWEDENNVKKFLLKIKDIYNLQTIEDWNKLSFNQIKENGGNTLLYKYSIFELKCIGFPEGKSYFDFARKPLGFWDHKENIIQFLNELKIKLQLNTNEDWSRLSKQQIKLHGGDGLAEKYSLEEIVQFYDPNIKLSIINENKKSSQRWLFLQIQQLFPGEEIVEDYFHPEISRDSGISVQFDIFLINKNIAFEYHGKQHYEDLPSLHHSIEMYQNRDKEKSKLCEKYGIKLIIIPYWWNNRFESLKQSIEQYL